MMSDMMTLKEARKLCDLTQKELAEEAQVNIRIIQKLECGKVKLGNITAKNFLALAAALLIDPYKLDLEVAEE